MTAGRYNVGAATALHFLVDGLCVGTLFLMAASGRDTMDVPMMLLAYNVLAFMTQPLTGWWADRLGPGRQTALVPVWTVSLASAVVIQMAAALSGGWGGTLPAVATVFLLGMGNSLFHVWGGKLTATLTGSDMRALGIFVSTGTLGLTVGMLYASWWLLTGMLLLIILLGIIARHAGTDACADASVSLPSSAKMPRQALYWLPGILAFVLMRSFIGEAASEGLEKTSTVLLFLAFIAMTGKALGGWVARRWGIAAAIAACLGITAACMMWRGAAGTPLLPVIAVGVFAINCTMPMTLWLSNRLLPGREGLSFGLLAAVLVPGYLLAKGLSLSPDHCFMLSALLLTIAIEVGMLLLMGERRKSVLAGAVCVNILTNVPLNFFLLTYDGSMPCLLMGELLVLLAEALWYYCLIRQWRRAAVYSLLCNATSFLTGVLIQYIIILLNLNQNSL